MLLLENDINTTPFSPAVPGAQYFIHVSLGGLQVLLLENDMNTTPFSPAVHAPVLLP